MVTAYINTPSPTIQQESKFFKILGRYYEFFSLEREELEHCFNYIKDRSDLYSENIKIETTTPNFSQTIKLIKVKNNF